MKASNPGNPGGAASDFLLRSAGGLRGAASDFPLRATTPRRGQCLLDCPRSARESFSTGLAAKGARRRPPALEVQPRRGLWQRPSRLTGEPTPVAYSWKTTQRRMRAKLLKRFALPPCRMRGMSILGRQFEADERRALAPRQSHRGENPFWTRTAPTATARRNGPRVRSSESIAAPPGTQATSGHKPPMPETQKT